MHSCRKKFSCNLFEVIPYIYWTKQGVLANGVYSYFLQVTQGVPQGSVLGPLFYIVYANDLSLVLKNYEIALYADDTVLYTANPVFEDSVLKLQDDMSSLALWCKANGVSINTDKTKIMTFDSPSTLSTLPAEHVTS